MKLILNWLRSCLYITQLKDDFLPAIDDFTNFNWKSLSLDFSLSLSHIAKHLSRQGSGENEEWIHLNIRQAANQLNS